jgi:methyl halide transferase
MSLTLDAEYWNSRYSQKETGWDLGTVSTPLKQYLDQIENKKMRILIPGAGNAYEAGYAHRIGFSNLNVLDFSTVPINNFIDQFPDFPKSQIHQEDFFLHQGIYDLILEQTFFCSLDPSAREKYVSKMLELLKPEGKLIGVLFNREFGPEGPPFGGTMEEYRQLFSGKFNILKMEECHNSIPPRSGKEIFIMLQKPQ